MNSQASKLVSIESPNCIFEQYEVTLFVLISILIDIKRYIRYITFEIDYFCNDGNTYNLRVNISKEF